MWPTCPQSPRRRTAPAPHQRPHPGHPQAAGQSPGAPTWSHRGCRPTLRPPPPHRWTAAVPWAAWPRPLLASQPEGGTSPGNPGPVRAPPSPREVGGPGHLHTNRRTRGPGALSLSLQHLVSGVWQQTFPADFLESSCCHGLPVPSVDLSKQLLLSPRLSYLPTSYAVTCAFFYDLLLLEKKQHTHRHKKNPTRRLRL